jgi:hypothetical protein
MIETKNLKPVNFVFFRRFFFVRSISMILGAKVNLDFPQKV